MTKILCAAAASVFAFTVSLSAQNKTEQKAADFRIERDVAYLGAETDEKADLYLPLTIPTGTRVPAVVIIHGGGFTGGKRDAARELNIAARWPATASSE